MITQRRVDLGQPTMKHTLVISLENVLLSILNKDSPEFDYIVHRSPEESKERSFLKFNVRPGLSEFLSKMAVIYEVVVFSFQEDYVLSQMIDTIDPLRHISYTLNNEYCLPVELEEKKRVSRLALKNVDVISNRP